MSARDTADQLFSQIVRSRGRCERCGSAGPLECAHIFSRRFTATRTDEANAVCLCGGCHLFFTLSPPDWDVWVPKHISRPRYLALERKARTECRKFDWSAEVKRLRGRLAEVNA